jgi:hypothetical protein
LFGHPLQRPVTGLGGLAQPSLCPLDDRDLGHAGRPYDEVIVHLADPDLASERLRRLLVLALAPMCRTEGIRQQPAHLDLALRHQRRGALGQIQGAWVVTRHHGEKGTHGGGVAQQLLRLGRPVAGAGQCLDLL